MSVQRASPAEQIANELRARIDDGRYKTGDTIPGDATLAAEFGVSKPTVTKARAMLVALGLIQSRPGTPSFITEPTAIPKVDIADLSTSSWLRMTRPLPPGNRTRIVEAGLHSLPANLADVFGTDQHDVIVRRAATLDADGAPLMSATSFYPGDLARSCPSLLEREDVPGGALLYIESQTHRRLASVAATVTSSPARDQPGAAEDLGLGPRSHVLVVTTTSGDADGRVLAHEIECHPPGMPVDLDVVSNP
ncbi:MAG: GntR family transcriptional regulator [Solirubrobacteraceae bacterium]|nr:GntR family transcriptional regulator [Solirubrobacteraceae bacterium]